VGLQSVVMSLLTRRAVSTAWSRVPLVGFVNSGWRYHGAMKADSFMRDVVGEDRLRGGSRRALFNSGFYAPKAFASNLWNERLAVIARILRETPAVDPQSMQRYVTTVKKLFKIVFNGFRKIDQTKPGLFEMYIKNSNARDNVKELLRKTKKELDEQGIGYDMVSRNVAYKWTTRKSFVKVENNLYYSPGGELLKAPRLISGASPQFVVVNGPLTMAIQGQIKNLWNSESPFYFTSGASNVDVANYIAGGVGKIMCNDVSAFDASQNLELGKLELWMYKQFGANPLQCQLFSENLKTHGFTHHGIKYRVPGTRKSGDPWTSLFNSILNALMHFWAYLELTGDTVREALGRFRIAVMGDDSVVRHSGGKLDFKHKLLELGFETEVNYEKSLMDVEYCNNIMYKSIDGGYVMGPKLGRVLSKLGYFVNPPFNQHPLAILKGVALGFLPLTNFIPLMSSIIAKILEITSHVVAVSSRYNDWQLKLFGPSGDRIYNLALMEHRYGLQPEQLVKMEAEMNDMEIGARFGGLFDLLMDRDTDSVKTIFVSR
jgi:hypothetical protein